MTGIPPLNLLGVPAPETGDQAIQKTPGVGIDTVGESDADMNHRIRLDAARATAQRPAFSSHELSAAPAGMRRTPGAASVGEWCSRTRPSGFPPA
ncbi:hypothetical protein ABZS88_43500 [Streptomyces sp. NPDC005480]|uniref:hypothetical protein n=1 Tax=Streptomyces sp. NPDC005480 TaxID=3154880 RepID=UPI0033A7D4E3